MNEPLNRRIEPADLNSKKDLNAFLKRCDDGFLQVLNAALQTHIQNREELRRKFEEAHREKLQRVAELVSLVAAEGFSLDDLAAASCSPGGGKRMPKYQFEVDGILRFWSGAGKMPGALQEQITEDKPLHSFLIRPE